MGDYKFGTFVFLPEGESAAITDKLRTYYDPVSARTSQAHITVTQPFSVNPNKDQIDIIETLLNKTKAFEIKVGPVITSPNKRLLWFDVDPKNEILSIRESLHELGFFRTDLPLTKGFLPHTTISEKGRDPNEVTSIIKELNSKTPTWNLTFDSLSWIVPDQKFVFHEFRRFKLSCVDIKRYRINR